MTPSERPPRVCPRQPFAKLPDAPRRFPGPEQIPSRPAVRFPGKTEHRSASLKDR